MLHWSIEEKKLELKYTWKISRNDSDYKINFFVRVSDGTHTGIGEVAPNIRYQETPESIKKQFEQFLSSPFNALNNIDDLENCLNKIHLSHALRFGIESAFTHFVCSQSEQSIFNFLGVNKLHAIPTTFSLPIMDIGKLKSFFTENKLSRFHWLKLKVNCEEGFETIKEVSKITDIPLRIDANEAFTDVEECIYFTEKIKKYRIEFLEQPLPSYLTEESVYLKRYSPFPLIADESLVNTVELSSLKNKFHGINMKLMKAGGYRNGIKILQQAKEMGFLTMIGCMVETSLGISSAMNLCSLVDFVDLDGFLIIQNEPFGLAYEQDGKLYLVSVHNVCF